MENNSRLDSSSECEYNSQKTTKNEEESEIRSMFHIQNGVLTEFYGKSSFYMKAYDNQSEEDEELYFRCANEKNIKIPNGVTKIGKNAFAGSTIETVLIPDSVTVIESGAFKDCRSLENIELPNGLIKICDGAFANCINLTSIEIPSSVTEIYNGFINCTKIRKMTVHKDNPNYCFEDGALYTKDKQTLVSYFYSDDSKTFIVPDTVKTIGECAFYRCIDLTNVVIPEGVEKIGKKAFKECHGLESIQMPKNLKSIGEEAFAACTKIKNIEIPHGVTEISKYAFAACSNLTSVKLPDGVLKVRDGAFMECKSLESILIPSSVTEIERSAFHGCVRLYLNYPS